MQVGEMASQSLWTKIVNCFRSIWTFQPAIWSAVASDLKWDGKTQAKSWKQKMNETAASEQKNKQKQAVWTMLGRKYY